MKIISDKTKTKRTRTFNVEGLPAQPIEGYSFKGKMFVPDYAEAIWYEPEVPGRVEIGGCVVKKDGTVGEQRTSYDVHLIDSRWNLAAPQWVRDLFAEPTQ